MSDKTIGIGMIGCGGMGRVTTGKLLTKDSRLKVVALCDPAPQSIDATREAFASDAQVYDDYHALVQAPDVDWVMIASWNCFHREQTVAAFEAGKHVFCQKPLGLSLEDCLAMKRAWKESGRLFTIGFTLRYSPHYRKIRELLDEGVIGDMISMEFNENIAFNHGGYIMGDWRRLTKNAGSHLLEKCCHDIDLTNWFVGSRASKVASFGGNDFFLPQNVHHVERLGKDKNGRNAYSTWQRMFKSENPFTSDKDILDNQVAIIEYENGVRAMFHANCNSAIPERRMLICGTEGAIRADVLTGSIEVCRIGFGEEIRKVEAGAKGGHGGGDDVLATELAASMLEGDLPAAGLDAGLESALTCFAIDEAQENGTVVELAEYWEKVDAGVAELVS